MYFYSKNFWEQHYSYRTTLTYEESQNIDCPTPMQEMFQSYIASTENDMSSFLQWYKEFSAFVDVSIQPQIPFEYILLANPEFQASIGFDSNFTKTTINLSFGLCAGIHDIMNRICCNQEVLNFTSEGKDTWQGTTCFYPQSDVIPEIRFSLYKPIANPYVKNTYNSAGFFNCGIPVGSLDRLYLASLMEFISLTWILYHEEAHYWQGHLFYLEFNNEITIDETNPNLEKIDSELLKVFEWQADRGAIVDLINMFFFSKEETPFELPEQFSDKNDLSDFIRIILCAIGTTILIFQKNKLIKNSSDYYPSPITRLSTAVGIIYSKLMTLSAKSSIYNIETQEELERKIREGLLNGLFDLYFVESVLTNNIDFTDGISRLNFEEKNPKSLFLFKDTSEIISFLTALLKQFDTDDKTLYEKWFKEYNMILNRFENVYHEILPKYRAMATTNGTLPYN